MRVCVSELTIELCVSLSARSAGRRSRKDVEMSLENNKGDFKSMTNVHSARLFSHPASSDGAAAASLLPQDMKVETKAGVCCVVCFARCCAVAKHAL